MEIFTKSSAKCTIFQSNNCNNFSSLMWYRVLAVVVLEDLGPIGCGETELHGGIAICYLSSNCCMVYAMKEACRN
jgi:hypothetical protein